jgi:hypothetical protein
MADHFHAGACKLGENHDQGHGAHCFNSVEEATQDMLRKVGMIAHETEAGCDRNNCGICSWCSAARALYRFFGKPFRKITQVEIQMNGHSEWDLQTPCEVIEVWAEQIDDRYETCPLRSAAVV